MDPDYIKDEFKDAYFVHEDVALTIGLPGHVATWCKSSYWEILNFLAPDAGPDCINHLMKKKLVFRADRHLQIKEFTGFHANTTAVIRADSISTIQAYCTEKNVMYSLSPGVFQQHGAKELLEKKM